MFLSFEHFVILSAEEEEEEEQDPAFNNTSSQNEAQQNFDKVSWLDCPKFLNFGSGSSSLNISAPVLYCYSLFYIWRIKCQQIKFKYFLFLRHSNSEHIKTVPGT